MKRVLTAAVLIPIVLLLVFRSPFWLFAGVVGIVVVLCLHEYLAAIKGYGIEPMRWMVYCTSILWLAAMSLSISAASGYMAPILRPSSSLQSILSGVFFLSPLIFGIPIVFRRDLRMALPAAAASAFGVAYIAIPLALLLEMRWTPGCAILSILTLLAVWVGDIAAYYVGKTMGRRKLAPIVSPNKTWEGAIGSLAGSVAVTFLVFHFRSPMEGLFRPLFGADLSGWQSVFHVGLLGVVLNVAAQFGDLFESAIKRGAQIKDSGSLVPGHGGILDRIDALLFALPAVWYYAVLTGFPLRSVNFLTFYR